MPGEGAAPDELGAHVAGGEDDGAVERHFQAEGREAGVLLHRAKLNVFQWNTQTDRRTIDALSTFR